jgi:sterol desaturase/sphingolipid hydroxylase (fatty acid hydroxylase superfamily)
MLVYEFVKYLCLAIVNICIICLIIELIFKNIDPIYKETSSVKKYLKAHVKIDLQLFLFNYLVVRLSVFALMFYIIESMELSTLNELKDTMKSWPLVLQFIVGLISFEFVSYWAHRAYHRVPLLWRFHLVHHSAKKLHYLTLLKNHPVQYLVSAVVDSLALALFIPIDVAFIIIVLVNTVPFIYHLNMKLDIPFLNRIIVTPRFHMWHHANEPIAHHANYGTFLSVFDWVFGTYYLPDDINEYPSKTGVKGVKVKNNLLSILKHPFSHD